MWFVLGWGGGSKSACLFLRRMPCRTIYRVARRNRDWVWGYAVQSLGYRKRLVVEIYMRCRLTPAHVVTLVDCRKKTAFTHLSRPPSWPLLGRSLSGGPAGPNHVLHKKQTRKSCSGISRFGGAPCLIVIVISGWLH